MNRPQTHEYPAWAETYIKLIDGDVIELLERQASEFSGFMRDLIEKADYAYAPGKWTIKEMMGHIVDTERILVYRLMCFARNEPQALPGFDEDQYVANAHFGDRSLFSLSEEFSLLRRANLYLFKSLNEAELERGGIANQKKITVRALLYVIAGHVMHHTEVVKERYL
jgi:hypothetical protein